jgi:septum site-determining protein MinC
LESLCRRELVALVSKLQEQNKSRLAASSLDSSTTRHPAESAQRAEAPASTPVRVPSLFVDHSVRSGQTIEFPAGDVTVVGSVGSGAEIVAGGSIHVYGTLRGRAVAGTAGDCTARILCRNFQAELVAINGRYRVAENLDPVLRGRPVQARLEGMGMTLTTLD